MMFQYYLLINVLFVGSNIFLNHILLFHHELKLQIFMRIFQSCYLLFSYITIFYKVISYNDQYIDCWTNIYTGHIRPTFHHEFEA